jgi:hypothetical protein
MGVRSVCYVGSGSNTENQGWNILEPNDEQSPGGARAPRKLKDIFNLFRYRNELKMGVRLLYLCRGENDNLTEKVVQEFIITKLETKALHNKIRRIAQQQTTKMNRILSFCLMFKDHLRYAEKFNSRKMTEEAQELIRRIGLPQHIQMESILAPIEL